MYEPPVGLGRWHRSAPDGITGLFAIVCHEGEAGSIARTKWTGVSAGMRARALRANLDGG
jgi:hypothetical protein